VATAVIFTIISVKDSPSTL